MAILIVDNNSSYVKKLEKTLKLLGVSTVTYRNKKFRGGKLRKFEGVIISGGESDRNKLRFNVALIRAATVPVLGICLGAEHIAQAYGSSIVKRPRKVKGWNYIYSVPFELAGDSKIRVFESHIRDIVKLNDKVFESIGRSDYSENEIIRHKTKKMWGLQFHPEKSSLDGVKLLANFARECGIDLKVEFLSRLERNQMCPHCGDETVFRKFGMFHCINGHLYRKSFELRYII